MRSDRAGLRLESLPLRAKTARPPAWPLPPIKDEELHALEIGRWNTIWTYPQAGVWARPEEKWRHADLALYCRLWARALAAAAPASLLTQVNRMAENHGLTTRGLQEMGYKIESTATRRARTVENVSTPKKGARAKVAAARK